MKTEDITLEYYEKNADAFFAGTVSADMTYARERFLAKLPGKTGCWELMKCMSGATDIPAIFMAINRKTKERNGSKTGE